MSTLAKQEAVKEQSPIEVLNSHLQQNNDELENLLSRLVSVGARVSANLPNADGDPTSKSETPILPFNDGYLMVYLNRLNRQSNIIQEIRGQVVKLEQLF